MMDFLCHLFPLIIFAIHVLPTWSRYDSREMCEALDEWTKYSLIKSQEPSPLLLKISKSKYTIGEEIEVTITGDHNFISAIIQTRSVSRAGNAPLGRWISDDVITVDSCHGISHDTAIFQDGKSTTNIEMKWKANEYHGSIMFVAKILDSSGKAWKMKSDVIASDNQDLSLSYNSLTLHERQKRDIDDTNETDSDVTPTGEMASTVYMTTENPPAATTASTSLLDNFDFEAFFGYAMIGGAYIGMYIVFSLIIV